MRRASRLPVLVMPPRWTLPPLEYSDGTRPRYAMSWRGVSKRVAGALAHIGSLHRLPACDDFAKTGFHLANVEPAVSFNGQIVQAGGFTELELAGVLAKIEYQARISTRQLNGAIDYSRRDIINLQTNDETRLFMRFRDMKGRYVMHCHNVVHEDHAMMVRWDIV